MRLNSISAVSGKRQSFGNGYVTLAKANLGDENGVIAKNIDAYNKNDFAKMYEASRKSGNEVIERVNDTLKTNNGRIKSVDDLVNKVDLYVLAAGSGSRFKPLADKVADLRDKGEQFNKISVPFELGNGQQPLTMLDIPMAMGRFFAPKEGYSKIIADKPTGSFGDVVLNYLDKGNTPKDVVVCCGDNVFDLKSEEMLDFVVRTINNPNKQLGVVGVARTPQEVAGQYGVLKVGEQNPDDATYPLLDFVEKPKLDVAQKLVTKDGVNVANTGMFVIKKESMEKLLDILQHERKLLGKTFYIAKDPVKEIYDFAKATEWTRNLNGAEASDVKMVERKKWRDVGAIFDFNKWLQEIKNGQYLGNYTPERKAEILDATQNRVNDNSIQFSLEPKGKGNVEGIEIIA